MSLGGDGTTRPSLPAPAPQLRVRKRRPQLGILCKAWLQARPTGPRDIPQSCLTKRGVRNRVPAIRARPRLSSSALPTHGNAEHGFHLRDGLLTITAELHGFFYQRLQQRYLFGRDIVA